MIVVTGAAGFIASCLVSSLLQEGYKELVLVDDFSNPAKAKNVEGKEIRQMVHRDEFFDWLAQNARHVEFIFHLGARTDTTEFDKSIFDRLNLNYSKRMWEACCKYQIPLVYASSAATYGLGEHGYEDKDELCDLLKPLNPYGESKNDFDRWAIQQSEKPLFWAGLKFFNVYGPNEYHKGRMASVVFHTFLQIQKTGSMRLFRSHRPDFKDGEQLRDFIYVKDVASICLFLLENRKHSGIYNVGTGKARTFYSLASQTFVALGKEPLIDFVDTPADIRDKYQYFTEANMAKLRSIGYHKPFYSLEEGINEYVKDYLVHQKYY